tara:strand:+ start:2158 stop:3411 length:1254 start_codon:yes stop_codon:yes gene_type:complete
MSYLGRSAKLSLKAQEKVSFLATAGQTVKTGLSYTPSFVEVYVNGVLLTDTTDFTATNGNSVTFTVALLLNDEVTVISLKTFTVADHYSKTEADTLLAAKATNTALATKLPLAGGTMTGDLVISYAAGSSNWALSSTSGDDFTISRNGSQKLLIDGSTGNVGIGTSSPTAILDVRRGDASGKIAEFHTSTGYGVEIGSSQAEAYIQAGSSQALKIGTNSTERMRIDSSGRLLVGCTSSPSTSVKGIAFEANGSNGFQLNSATPASGVYTHARFINPNGIVGKIQTNGSSTSYNTSSDYRLKENVTPMSGAIARVKLLKPCNFDWISTGENVDGFLAHEAQEVVPESVTGTKDAMMDEEYEVTPAVLDDEGNETTAAVIGTRSVPDMQGIDQSKLVPLLTATIQELIARIEVLEGAAP